MRRLGQVEHPVELAGERRGAMELEGEPDERRAVRSRQLGAPLEVVRQPRERGDPAEVRAAPFVRVDEQRRVADEQTPDAIWQEQALVCVDGHGVGALDAPQALTAPGGQGEEPAVRGVDVEPGAGIGCDVGQAVERVDAAGVRTARGGDDEERRSARGRVGLDRLRQLVRVTSPLGVGRDRPDRLRRDADQPRRLDHRVMHPLRGVHRPAGRITGVGTRRDERRLVRERPARQQDATRGWRQAEEVRHPTEHALLHRDHGGRLERRAGEGVRAGGQQGGDRARVERAVRDEREVPARGLVPARGGDPDEPVEDPVEGLALGRRRLTGDLEERIVRRAVVAGRLAQVAQPLQRRGCLERRRPSAVRVKLESMAHAATLPAAALVEAVASRRRRVSAARRLRQPPSRRPGRRPRSSACPDTAPTARGTSASAWRAA